MTRGLGWRIFQTLLLHLAGLAVVTLRILYVFFVQGAAPFLNMAWLPEIFGSARGMQEIFVIIIVLIFSASFYFAGAAMIRRPSVHLSIARRLDLGIGVFIALLLINAGVGLANPTITFLLFPFFFLGMLALFLARSDGKGKKEYLPGHRWMGATLTFSVAVLIFTVAVVLLFLPYLTMAAETGLTLLKWVFNPLFYSFLLPILRFMFGARSIRSDPEAGSFSDDSSVLVTDSAPDSFWGELFIKIMGFGIFGLAALVLLIAAGWGIRRLFFWLASRSPQEKERGNFWGQFLLLFLAVRLCWEKLIFFVRRTLLPFSPESSEAIKMYKRLLSWGRFCGFPHLIYDTPREYGLRIASYFPMVKAEVELIISLLNREIYGGIPVDKKQSALLKRAWRKLSSPLLWFSRIIPGKR